jgi:hypothetical protein
LKPPSNGGGITMPWYVKKGPRSSSREYLASPELS